MSVKNYRDLIAWQKAMDLVIGIYATVRELPDIERYGLAAQLRRSAVSIPVNIAVPCSIWPPKQDACLLAFIESWRETTNHAPLITLPSACCRLPAAVCLLLYL
jgi:hypothetical protein